MAKRRALARALSGLGEGIGNAGTYMFRQSQQERMQDRYDDRQDKTIAAQASAAEVAEVARLSREIKAKVATGELEPTQAAAMLQDITGGQSVAPDSFNDIRPSPRRRMEKAIGAGIDAATTPEMVDSPESIFSKTEALGEPSRLPTEWSEGMIPAENDPFQNATPLVREYGERAGAKRRSLESKPTREVKYKDPISGAEGFRMMSDYDPEMRAGMPVGPTAEKAGEFKGIGEVAETTVAGKARAAQKGLEKQSELDVELAPGNVNRRVAQAGRVSGAQESGQINARLANSSKIIDFETQKALAAIKTAGSEVEVKEWGKQIADARAAANSAMPVIGQLRVLWEKAQPQIEAMAAKDSAVLAAVEQGTMPRSTLPTDVRKYLDLLEAARPRLARAMGNVGNFTEGEQARAGYIAPDFVDGINGGVTGYDKLDRIEQLFLAGPAIAQRNRPGSKPMTGDEINAIVAAQRRAKPGDVELSAPQYDILLKPGGR